MRYEIITDQGIVARERTLAAALSLASAKTRNGEVAVVHNTKTGQTQCRDCGRFSCNC